MKIVQYSKVWWWMFFLTYVSVEVVVDGYCRVCEVEVFSYLCECRGSGRWILQGVWVDVFPYQCECRVSGRRIL